MKRATFLNCKKVASIVRRRTLICTRAFVDVEDFFHSDSQLPYQSQRQATIREGIAARLRRVCPDMTETEFQSLVDDMTEKQLRSERRLSDW